jgi:hypothetical protein
MIHPQTISTTICKRGRFTTSLLNKWEEFQNLFASNYVLDDTNGRGITLENVWKTHKQ